MFIVFWALINFNIISATSRAHHVLGILALIELSVWLITLGLIVAIAVVDVKINKFRGENELITRTTKVKGDE